LASKREHLRASKVLLGSSDPLVHALMDQEVRMLGYKYRYISHNMEYIENIGRLLGREAELQAFLHLLMDMELVTKYDYRKRRKGKIERNQPSSAGKRKDWTLP